MKNDRIDKAAADLLGGVKDSAIPATKDFTYWRTINPFASMLGGNIRIPEWWARMWGVSEDGSNEKAAVISGNLLASAGVLAAGVAGLRGMHYLARMAKLRESDDAAADMAKQLGATYSSAKAEVPEEQSKKASTEPGYYVDRNRISDLGAILLAASVPVAGFAAAAGSYRLSDKLFGNLRNQYISGSVDDKSRRVSSLMRVRAMLARGKMTPDEARKAVEQINGGEDYIKTAAQDGPAKSGIFDSLASWWLGLKNDSVSKASASALSCASLILLGLFGASAVGSYYYTKSNSARNRRYEAFSKGLKDYARSKASLTPIDIMDAEKNIYADLDKDEADKVREEPEVDFGAVSKPVSITL